MKGFHERFKIDNPFETGPAGRLGAERRSLGATGNGRDFQKKFCTCSRD